MSKSIRILLFVLLLSAVPVWGQVILSTTGPAITSIAPTSAPVGTPSLTLTVYGKNFVSGGSTITWNGTAMPTSFVSSGKLYTFVPGNFLMTAGTVKIAVAARLGTTASVSFTIVSDNSSVISSNTTNSTSTNSTTSDSTSTSTNSTTSSSTSSSTAFAVAALLPNGSVGATYKAGLVKGGTAPYFMAITTGALPAGITFDAATGFLVGAPKMAATYAFAVSVKDSTGHSASNRYTMTVDTPSMVESDTQSSALLGITTPSLPVGSVGSAYNATLSATGGRAPYQWRIASGALPPGLTLNGLTGVITGIPTMGGTASFTAEVRDSTLTIASYTYSVNIGTMLAKPL